MPETIVITRPRDDAEKLAADLTEKGFYCITEPILSMHTLYANTESLENALEFKPQAILATSKHAISAFAELTGVRSVPLVTVGRTTGSYALHHGFYNVVFANGTAKSLVSFISGGYSPENGRLLYIRGKDVSTDIATQLEAEKFIVDSVIVYEAKRARKLSEQLCKAITENKISSVAFYSQNTAKTYARLVKNSGIVQHHETITALCMSQAIAERVRSLLPWKEVTLFPSYLRTV